MQASTGFVRASGYADKLRRVVFAQLRDSIRRGEIDQRQVAYRVGRVNEALYKVLVEMGVRKDDVVRIILPFSVKDGDLVVDWRNIEIEVYRRDEELSRRAKNELIKMVESGLIDIDFAFKPVKREGVTEYYDVLVGNEKVGRVAVVDMGNGFAVSGAVVINGRGYRVGGLVGNTENLEVALRRLVNEAIIENREIPVEEAEKIIEG